MHYFTTNSCNAKGGASEEFWNCADVEIRATDGSAKPSSGKTPAPYAPHNFVDDPKIENQWDLKCPFAKQTSSPYFEGKHCATVANVVSLKPGDIQVPPYVTTEIQRHYLVQDGTSPHAPGYNKARCGADYVSPPYNTRDDGDAPSEPENPDPEKPTVTVTVTSTKHTEAWVTTTKYVDEHGNPTSAPSRSLGRHNHVNNDHPVSYSESNTQEEQTSNSKNGGSSSSTGMIIGASAGGVLALTAAGAAGFMAYKKKTQGSNELNVNSSTWLNDDNTGTSSYESKL
jgi:hypothetical protein